MADYRAISSVCDAVIRLLRSHYRRDDFGTDLEFKVYVLRDFLQPMSAGVSLFLYRAVVNGNQRLPTVQVGANGMRAKTMLPLDLHFLLTVWGQDPSLQHTIAGWMMRTLEDNPVLPSGLLNEATADVFHPDETVDIVLMELPNEDLLRIWETVAENAYHLSVPYLARNVRIESRLAPVASGPVQTRQFDFAG